MAKEFEQRANTAVFIGDFLPAHDATFDIAEQVAEALGRLHRYITEVRDEEQATNAVNELLDALAGKPVGPAAHIPTTQNNG